MLTRREMILGTGGAAVAACLLSGGIARADSPEKKLVKPFRIALNTGTIMGYDLEADKEIDIASEAGYDGIELWIGKIRRHIERGGKAAELRKRIEDKGLKFENAIGFPAWLVDDDIQRAKGIAEITRDMELLAELGCSNIAAPASGVAGPLKSIEEAGKRYRTILEIGAKIGVRPLLEIWGGSQALGKLSVATAVAVAAGHKDAALLLDAYHTYKGGNEFESYLMLNGKTMPIFHINDYPADPPRERIGDGDRVYPGDGVCPLKDVLNYLRETGFEGTLSLELFNRNYWRNGDALEVAKTGLAKTKAIIEEI